MTAFGQNVSELNEQSKKLIEAKEFDKAVPILKQAAELGNSESQYNLANCYQAGIGVEQNSVTAVEWYSKSAEQGWNDSIYAMMMAYGNGSGVKQDFNKAFMYALKCAENEDGTCMYNVIMCYNEGRGIAKDTDEMLKWSFRLGKFENPENLQKSGYITFTRLLIAYMYRDGINVEQDYYKSYQWFLIFNESKKDLSFLEQEQIIQGLLNLEGDLTKYQKINGQSEAEKIINRPLKNIGNLYKAEM